MFNKKIGLILVLALAAGLGLLAAQKFFGPVTPATRWPATQTVTLFPQARPLPPFSLRQSDGTQLADGELKGHWTLVFLGFTFCPDVCPTTLAELAQAMRELGPQAAQVQVLFVTIDPQRDTLPLLAQYAPAFDPSFVGLTGSPEHIAQVAKQFKAVYRRQDGQGGSQGNDYTMDHSAGAYLLDREGKLRVHVAYGSGSAAFVHDLQLLLK